MVDSLIPDYDRRNLVIQPQLIRSRAPFRGTLDSEKWNLEAEQLRYDVSMLRSTVESLRLELTEQLSLVEEEQDFSWVDSDDAYVDYPGTTGNYLVLTQTMAADSTADWRMDMQRPANPASYHEMTNYPTYIRYDATGISAFIYTSVLGFVTAAATYAALAAAGFPAVGEWVQLRGTWDKTTDTCTLQWRASSAIGPPNLDNNTGWTTAATTVDAGKQIYVDAGPWYLGGTAADAAIGKVRRWMRLMNGSLVVDVNSVTDIPVDNGAPSQTFTATTGQTVTVLRSGTPSVTLFSVRRTTGILNDIYAKIQQYENRIRRLEIEKGLKL